MKLLNSSILLVIFLFQSFGNVVFYVHYELNKKYIAEVLCENKDKPEMHCNGKCHLKKQIKAVEKQTVPEAENFQAFKISVVYFEEQDTFETSELVNSKNKKTDFYNNLYKFQFIGEQFHPPQV